MKDKLVNALGWGGLILWWMLQICLIVVPILAINFTWWAKAIIFLVIMCFRFWGTVVRFGVDIYAFLLVIKQPIDTFSIIFFVCIGLTVLLKLIPAIIDLVIYWLEKGRMTECGDTST